MTGRKKWTVSLYKGADADPTYKRLTNWSLKEDVFPTIYAHTYDTDGNPNYTKLKPVYQMELSSIIVPNREIDFDMTKIDFYDIYNCNYLIAQANYDMNKIYYGFIESVDYVNDGVARISWKIDYWATYKDKINLAKAQYVRRAVYAPKNYMLDARRTLDSSLPTDQKQRLVYINDVVSTPIAGDADQQVKESNKWYLFYLMPKSNVKKLFDKDGTYPSISLSSDHDDTSFSPSSYEKLGTEETTKDDVSVNWINLDKAFTAMKNDLYDPSQEKDNSAVRIAMPEVYASTDLSEVLTLSTIAGEGIGVLGCEVRNSLDLTNFTEVKDGLYKYDYNGIDTVDNYLYETDTSEYEIADSKLSFSNNYDKNRYREELTVAGKNLSVDPSLRLSQSPCVHVWDSVIPGFKPVYSFYCVNGQIDYLYPGQAGDNDLVVTADVDRSIPLYGDQGIGYYLSHLNRINSEIEKQIVEWKAQIKNSQVAYRADLAKIAKEYNVSLLDLENSLYNSKGIAQFNNSEDSSLLSSNYSNNQSNAISKNGIDKDIMTASQTTAKSNLSKSQGVSESNLTDSNTTALSNLKSSQATSESNLETSQNASVKNLLTSYSAQVNNLDTANNAEKMKQSNSIDTANKNAKAQADQNKANLDTNLNNQNKNLDLQKAESFVTGLNLTAGLAKFLTGALTSLITGFLDVETAKAVAQNNTDTQKDIIDANLKLQTDTISQNNLKLALDNLDLSLKASKEQASSSNEASKNNLTNSNLVAKNNLTNSNLVAKNNLISSQATALSNLKRSNAQALSNLESSNATALSNLSKSLQKELTSLSTGYHNSESAISTALSKTLNSLDKNNELSKVNLNNSTVKAYILAKITQNASQDQLANSITASVDSYVTGLKAQMEDWVQGNWSKLTDGNGIATKVFDLLTPKDKIYEVQASTERQIKDKIYTTGALINRKMSLKPLLLQPDLYSVHDQLHDYFLTDDKVPVVTHKTDYLDNRMYIRQYVQTDNVQLEGSAPSEALQTLQNALNSGVYLTIDSYGSYKDGTDTINSAGNTWDYYKQDKNYALKVDNSNMNANPDWNQNMNNNIREIENGV